MTTLKQLSIFVLFLLLVIPDSHSVPTKKTGEPVPGAEIYIELEPDDEPIANVTTNNEGEFEFAFPPGIKIPLKGEFTLTITPPKKTMGSKTKKISGMKKQIIVLPFEAKADKKFKFILIWEIDAKAENKGAFAVSGKNST